MRLKSAVLGVLFSLAPVFPVLAQQPSNVAEVVFMQAKPGVTPQQFDAARKKHAAWHKNQKDTWTWLTWEVLSGEGTGTVVAGTFQHAWKDFDGREQFDAADNANFATTMGPLLAHFSVGYYIERADMSLSPSTPATVPAPLATITLFTLKPEGLNDFIEAVKKINDGIKKTSYAVAGPSRWYQLINGGEGPLFVLAGDRANWAAFQPNAKSLDAMMEEAYGKEQGAATLASLRKAIRTSVSSTYKYRGDLSYIAPK
jgi:hypothetical protein